MADYFNMSSRTKKKKRKENYAAAFGPDREGPHTVITDSTDPHYWSQGS